MTKEIRQDFSFLPTREQIAKPIFTKLQLEHATSVLYSFAGLDDSYSYLGTIGFLGIEVSKLPDIGADGIVRDKDSRKILKGMYRISNEAGNNHREFTEYVNAQQVLDHVKTKESVSEALKEGIIDPAVVEYISSEIKSVVDKHTAAFRE